MEFGLLELIINEACLLYFLALSEFKLIPAGDNYDTLFNKFLFLMSFKILFYGFYSYCYVFNLL